MPEHAVSDTGPALHLTEAGLVSHLALFGSVAISQYVRTELRRAGALRALAEALADRLCVEQAEREEVEAQGKLLAAWKLHTADLSTAALAARLVPDIVLTDDLALRRALESQRFAVAGSIGVLVRAYRMGRVGREQLDESLDRLLDGSSLYTSKAFRMHVRSLLDQADE